MSFKAYRQDDPITEERLAKVLVAPLVSEKSTRLADSSNQFAFEVLADATKPEIRAAVEKLFKVEVEAVQVLNQKGKQKMFRQVRGRRSDVKKAYVRLAAGQDIDFMGVD